MNARIKVLGFIGGGAKVWCKRDHSINISQGRLTGVGSKRLCQTGEIETDENERKPSGMAGTFQRAGSSMTYLLRP